MANSNVEKSSGTVTSVNNDMDEYLRQVEICAREVVVAFHYSNSDDFIASIHRLENVLKSITEAV